MQLQKVTSFNNRSTIRHFQEYLDENKLFVRVTICGNPNVYLVINRKDNTAQIALASQPENERVVFVMTYDAFLKLWKRYKGDYREHLQVHQVFVKICEVLGKHEGPKQHYVIPWERSDLKATFVIGPFLVDF
jgi:hypothetical protein